ncbi:hypothetical protein CDD83_4492 [Cordyceps sp. RAO-2017]|nr:hypothetical protein CDD83_4492 [Cordyceps sp. RAO-2017]
MQAKTILYALVALAGAAAAAPSQLEPRFDWGTEKRTAQVTIRNESPEEIKSVSLVHKYSSVYKHRALWPVIGRGQSAKNETTVEYNIGPLTTGRDWWMLSFFSSDAKTQYVTDPNNFREVVDFLETLGTVTTISLAGATAGVLGMLAGPVTSIAASTAAAALAKAASDSLYNSETTVGFKQHILRSEDADQLTTITVNADYSVTFSSKSGISRTVTAKRPAKIQVKDQDGKVVEESEQK